MPVYSLHKVSSVVEGVLYGNSKQTIDSLITDSRNIVYDDNSLFIALKGPRHDGHVFIEELISRGIMNFMISDKSYIKEGANFILVDSTLKALQKLATNARRDFLNPVIGITGSNGKTIVKEWLYQCLSSKYRVIRSPKSYNSQIGVPLSVWLLNNDADYGIIEAGISEPKEMVHLEQIIKPTIGIFTNIGATHQENFTSVKEKVEEKLQLFSQCDKVVYCEDHKSIHEQLSSGRYTNCELINWSTKSSTAWLTIISVQKNQNKTIIGFKNEILEGSVVIPFSDEASLENCLHILTLLLYLKYTPEDIQDCFDNLTPVAMRMEQMKGINNCTLINDAYNNDINSLKIALDQLNIQKQHPKKTVILSDIYQSGFPDEILYQKVSKLIGNHNINRLIGVGSGITKCKKLFPQSAKFYLTTDAFLSDLDKLSFSDEAILLKGSRKFSFEKIAGFLTEKQHNTVLEINLNNLLHNLNHFRSLLKNTKIMVMVKALSYGSGTFEIANLLQHQKVDYLGVAFTDEGVELRNAGIKLPIMVMAPDTRSFEKIISYNLEPEIYSFKSLSSLIKSLRNKQITGYPVHIKIDSGMHRLGFLKPETSELISVLKKHSEIKVRALFTHLSASDNKKEDSFTHKQLKEFNEIYSLISSELKIQPLRHVLNSAGIERFPEYHYEMVRLGIGLHGISATNEKLLAVSTLKTHISQIKELDKGETVGYNRRGIITKPTRVGIIPVGYADGIDRKLGNGNMQVIINGSKATVIGDICMDMCMVDLSGIKAEEEDEVIIFGAEQPINILAEQLETIPYEIITSISSRVVRKYVNE